MEIDQYITKMKNIQNTLLAYIEGEDVSGSNYANLNKLLDDLNIRRKKHELKSLLHLISVISNHHHRFPSFFPKIFQILRDLRNDMQNFFSNLTIFNIFRKNKRILLFLFDERILIVNETIVSIIKTNKYSKFNYPEYFLTEIRPFVNDDYVDSLMYKMPEEYEKYRRIGEGFYTIVDLIIEDKIDEFVSYVNERNLSFNYIPEISIVETNPLLITNQSSLIEYAFFYGSKKIINCLIEKGVELTSSLWFYAIHSNNLDIIKILGDHEVNLPKKSFKGVLWESIKCHHVELTNYIIQKYYKELNRKSYLFQSLKYYNFNFIDEKLIDDSLFFNLCKYDYFDLVNKFLNENKNIDVNQTKVLSI